MSIFRERKKWPIPFLNKNNNKEKDPTYIFLLSTIKNIWPFRGRPEGRGVVGRKEKGAAAELLEIFFDTLG